MTKVDQLFAKIRYISFAMIAIVGIAIIVDVPAYFRIAVYTEQYLGIYLAMVLFGIFISIPRRKGESFNAVDLILALLSIAAGLFITVYYPEISQKVGRADNIRMIFGSIAVLLILEALRRTMGLSLVIVVGCFLGYAKFASYVPGLFHGRPFTLAKIVNYIYLDPNSLLYMLSFGATVGVAFIFFGQVLLHFGGGKAFIDIALLLCGKAKGGSAKAAVISSSLVGTITGAPMSNVLLTGSVTIPMMKEAGYKPHVAAAVEAVASSGGQIMPPVMGIAAFIIAETLGVPYSQVAIAAVIPAVLFYVAIFIQVHMEAGKFDLKLISEERLVKPKQAFMNGWFIFPPIILLLSLMFFFAFPPAISAIIAGFFALPCLAIKPENRRDFFERFLGALSESGELMISIGAVMAGAGLIVGAINASGLAFNLSLSLTQLGQGNVVLLLICAAVSSLILGMGMPSVAAYALVSILVAPSLIQFGVLPMAAHLFVFYFAVISNITPPVAVSCFAAAPLAGANPTKTGITSFKLGIASYIVPFIFCFQPTLLMIGSPWMIIADTAFVCFGLFGVCIALAGYFTAPVSMPRRLMLTAISAVILIPTNPLINSIGTIMLLIVFLPDIRTYITKMTKRTTPAC
jgi:TRAP transporter 4TM/12TM fusion protein